MDGNIFISYRRGADNNAAGRLYDRLERHFDAEHLFFDIDSIPIGIDFADYIEAEVAKCDVQLVLIGPSWIENIPRLQNPDDPVRLEIETALNRADMPVVPILCDGAALPSADVLPKSIRPLRQRNAITLSHAAFAQVVDGRLASELRSILSSARAAEVPRVEEGSAETAPPTGTRAQEEASGSAPQSSAAKARAPLGWRRAVKGALAFALVGAGVSALYVVLTYPPILNPPSGQNMTRLGNEFCVGSDGFVGATKTLSGQSREACFRNCTESWTCYGVTMLGDSQDTCYLHQEPIFGILQRERGVGTCYERVD